MKTILILCITTLFVASCDQRASPEAKQLASAIKDAEKVVIFHNATTVGRSVDLSIGKATYTAIREHDGIEQGFQCLCYADYVIVWYKDDKPICQIGFQPDLSLSWPNGPPLGDIRVQEALAQTLYGEIQTQFETGKTLKGYSPPIP